MMLPAAAPAVADSTPVIHLLGARSRGALPYRQRAVTGPQIVSVDHNRDKPQQSTTINPRTRGRGPSINTLQIATK